MHLAIFTCRMLRLNHQSRAERATALLFLAVAAVLGWRSLVDVDLGWHLATGLWIIDHFRVPVLDPFGAQAWAYLCYSWLFETVVAWIYEFGGFKALQLAQTFLILLSALVALAAPTVRGDAVGGPAKAIASGVVMLFLVPIWHLRPQLVSVILFPIVLWALKNRRSALAVITTVVWANVHVYWVFSPIAAGSLLVLDSALKRDIRGFRRGAILACVLSLAGFATPFGIEMYRGLFTYAFNHAAANELIREFQPLQIDFGYLGVLVAASAMTIVSRFRVVRTSTTAGEWCLFLLFLVWGVLRIKLLPFYGLVSAPLLLRATARGVPTAPLARGNRVLEVFLGVVLAALLFLFFQPAPPLSQKYRELLAVTARLSTMERDRGRTRQEIVLNHFDDGGWLALGFYLTDRTDRAQFRTAIDGRTLVMGERRLREFQKLRLGGHDGCAVVSLWRPDLAVLPAAGTFVETLINQCQPRWTVVFDLGHWVVLRRGPVLERGVQ
ncbi:MAG: hypothetical protein IT290_11680 [Deltaproteobacteria bacterium]|nr:hypothetical protein [Deltaproteobacteria bacterium]